jgi:hypothetical protein
MNEANANVSQAELDKFDELAHRWASRGFRAAPPRAGERPRKDARAGVPHQGRFEASFAR